MLSPTMSRNSEKTAQKIKCVLNIYVTLSVWYSWGRYSPWKIRLAVKLVPGVHSPPNTQLQAYSSVLIAFPLSTTQLMCSVINTLLHSYPSVCYHNLLVTNMTVVHTHISGCISIALNSIFSLQPSELLFVKNTYK